MGSDLSQGGAAELKQYKIDLPHSRLEKSDIAGFDLSFADLHRATLWRSNLSGANLEGADLSSVNLNFANLNGANLRLSTFVVPSFDIQDLLKPTFRSLCSLARLCTLRRYGTSKDSLKSRSASS